MIHEWAGFPTFGKKIILFYVRSVLTFATVVDPLGPHRIGLKVKREEFLEFLADKLRPTAFKPKPEKIKDDDEYESDH